MKVHHDSASAQGRDLTYGLNKALGTEEEDRWVTLWQQQNLCLTIWWMNNTFGENQLWEAARKKSGDEAPMHGLGLNLECRLGNL